MKWEKCRFPHISVTELNVLCFFLFCFVLNLSLAALGLLCCAFSSCGERGLLFVAVGGLLIAVVSLVGEHGL